MNKEKIIEVIEAHVKEEAEKMFQAVSEKNSTAGDWNAAIWELGRPQNEGTDIEKLMHQLTYMEFSKKARAAILHQMVNTNLTDDHPGVTVNYKNTSVTEQETEGISLEKLAWMKEVGIGEFDKPMKYYTRFGHVYSEDYIKNTPLEKIKAGYESIIPKSEED